MSGKSNAPDHPSLRVTRRALSKGTGHKYTSQLLGCSPPIVYRVTNSTLDNLIWAIKERHIFVQVDGQFEMTPTPTVNVKDTLAKFTVDFRKVAPHSTPCSYDNFVMLASGPKRELYRKAADSLLRVPLTVKDSFVFGFLKCLEKGNKPKSAPRFISPRDPRYNVEVGCYLKPLEHRIFDALSRLYDNFGLGRNPVVFKGMNASNVGQSLDKQWRRFVKPVAVGLDASRFDQHVSREMLEFEHSIYMLCFDKHYQGKLNWLLGMQLDNKIRAYCNEGHIKYDCSGHRMSGDMNTSLGNCVIMCAMVYVYAMHLGIKITLANNGDDCVVMMEQDDLTLFMRDLVVFFKQLGFTMKVETPVYDLEKVEFCQTHPVWTPTGYIAVRNCPTGIAKDCVSTEPFTSVRMYKAWTRAVGEGGLSLTGGIPIYQEWYTSLIRSSDAVFVGVNKHRGQARAYKFLRLKETGMWRLSSGMSLKYCDIHPQTRYSFWLAFGISPDQQIVAEDNYRKFTHTPLELDCEGIYPIPAWV